MVESDAADSVCEIKEKQKRATGAQARSHNAEERGEVRRANAHQTASNRKREGEGGRGEILTITDTVGKGNDPICTKSDSHTSHHACGGHSAI